MAWPSWNSNPVSRTKHVLNRDVTTEKIQVRPHQWWAESAPFRWNRIFKVSEDLGMTAVVPVAPVDTSLLNMYTTYKINVLV